MQLELSAKERALLEQIVERTLADLRVEVRRTSTPKYHDALEADQTALADVLARLKALSG